MSVYLESIGACVDQIIARLGHKINVATPLGIGKSNYLLNELYKRAESDSSLQLNIYTALTLEKPKGKSTLEKSFLGPFVNRVYGDYPDFLYETNRKKLPKNIQVFEFYFPAGKHMNNSVAQQNYMSSNYTHVARDLSERKINLITQEVAKSSLNGKPRLSLSSNPDVTLDLLDLLKKKGEPPMFVGVVNQKLPFMYGDAIQKESLFDCLVDHENYYHDLFVIPKMSISDEDYMIGFYASSLIKDGGELQIGIGSLGDALVQSLLFRHKENQCYQKMMEDLGVIKKFGSEIKACSTLKSFQEGLFAATEMFVDSLIYLLQAGVLKRKVFDHAGIQRLLNQNKITTKIKAEDLETLVEYEVINDRLTQDDVRLLKYFGYLKSSLRLQEEEVICVSEFLNDPDFLNQYLGEELINGAVVHGGFFVGSSDFYDYLRGLSEKDRSEIHMKRISKVNHLYGHEEMDRLHRKEARFVNTCLKMTLLGAAVSDGLEDGRIISGVGGQYNFVAQAHALEGARSILQLRSTRVSNGRVESNIVWNYGHVTIPRHLRDIVITEYGIALLRGKSDSEVIQSLLNITDSRFQDVLLMRAQKEGKLSLDYKIPQEFCKNLPDQMNQNLSLLRTTAWFSKFPFGTEFSKEEQVIGGALKALKKISASRMKLIGAIISGIMVKSLNHQNYLKRMGLESPNNLKEKIYRWLLISELEKYQKPRP